MNKNMTEKPKNITKIAGLDYIIPSASAFAVGRFDVNGPFGYKASNIAYESAPLRATRAEAVQDYIAAIAKATDSH